MASLSNWTFAQLPSQFPPAILPNTAFYSATNGSWEFTIQLSWPLNWTSMAESAALDSIYILDGNALGLSGTESIRRRRPVDLSTPDVLTISIGYPSTLPDSPYSSQRGSDFQPPVCSTCPPAEFPGVPSNADEFIAFIDDALRPWVKDEVFANAEWGRDALYGHSFGGLFVLYALTKNPGLFDTFIAASPALFWNGEYVFNEDEFLAPLLGSGNSTDQTNATKPAFQIAYGALEQFPVRRRTETQEQFEFRLGIQAPMRMTDLCQKLFDVLKDSAVLRDVELHEYPFSDHAAVGGAALSDGYDYFLDW